MFDLGNTVPLSLVNGPAGTPVCTVTKPDGTTSTPAVSGTQGAGYTASYITTAQGRHTVTWTATGYSFADVFNVGPAASTALVSLAEVKSYMNINVSTWDSDLRDMIVGCTPVVEYYTGPIVQRTVDMWYDGGSPLIALVSAPCVSITSVTETFGANVIRTLVNQPLDGVTPVDAFGYTADLESGIVTRRVSGMAAPFANGRRNVHVVHVAGLTSVPSNVQEATKELIRVNWQPKTGGMRAGYSEPGGVDNNVKFDGAIRLGFFVPNRVIEMLQPSGHSWGIA